MRAKELAEYSNTVTADMTMCHSLPYEVEVFWDLVWEYPTSVHRKSPPSSSNVHILCYQSANTRNSQPPVTAIVGFFSSVLRKRCGFSWYGL